MKIFVKKLHPDAQIPSKAHPEEDAGFDLYSCDDIVEIKEGEVKEVKTGVALEIPQGYYGQIMTRSSFGKKGLRVHPGVVDSGYRGEITIFVYNLSDQNARNTMYVEDNGYAILKGDKVAQLLILPVPAVEMEETDDLGWSSRGANGFGSTGR